MTEQPKPPSAEVLLATAELRWEGSSAFGDSPAGHSLNLSADILHGGCESCKRG